MILHNNNNNNTTSDLIIITIIIIIIGNNNSSATTPTVVAMVSTEPSWFHVFDTEMWKTLVQPWNAEDTLYPSKYDFYKIKEKFLDPETEYFSKQVLLIPVPHSKIGFWSLVLVCPKQFEIHCIHDCLSELERSVSRGIARQFVYDLHKEFTFTRKVISMDVWTFSDHFKRPTVYFGDLYLMTCMEYLIRAGPPGNGVSWSTIIGFATSAAHETVENERGRSMENVENFASDVPVPVKITVGVDIKAELAYTDPAPVKGNVGVDIKAELAHTDPVPARDMKSSGDAMVTAKTEKVVVKRVVQKKRKASVLLVADQKQGFTDNSSKSELVSSMSFQVALVRAMSAAENAVPLVVNLNAKKPRLAKKSLVIVRNGNGTWALMEIYEQKGSDDNYCCKSFDSNVYSDVTLDWNWYGKDNTHTSRWILMGKHTPM